MNEDPAESAVSAQLIHRIARSETLEQLVHCVSDYLHTQDAISYAQMSLCEEVSSGDFVLASAGGGQACIALPSANSDRQHEYALQDSSGSVGTMTVCYSDADGPNPDLQGLADLMALKMSRFAQCERYCALTGLMRRKLFSERLDAFCASAKGPLYLGVVSIDRLAWVNKNYGHDSGDLLLKETARRLRQVLGEAVLIARSSGDRFLFCFAESHLNYSVDSVGPRLLSEISNPVSVGNVSLTVTASIGMAHMGAEAFDEALLATAAERALAEIKGQGGNAVIIAHPTSSEMLDYTDLTVRNALDHGEITAFLQPIYNAKTNRLSGFEALARWQRPNGDVVGPAEFLEPIRRLGLASKQCRCVVAALRDFTARCPKESAGLHLSLNVSNHELSDYQLISELCEWSKEMRALGFVPVIEVNEDTDIRPNEQGISGSIIRLEEASAEISLDDFGTGNGSTSRLLNIPAHYLKIDRRFVSIMHDDPKGLTVIEALLLLAKGFGMKAVAEGVETEKDCELLRELGCELLQGFYFAPAICVEAALNLVGQECMINPRSSLAG